VGPGLAPERRESTVGTDAFDEARSGRCHSVDLEWLDPARDGR
jgi:hypothetical protein